MTSVLVTGATDDVGRVVARDLAARGLEVLVHGRDAARAAAVADEIGAAGVHLADFSVLSQVRSLAEALPRVDVLVSNAGLISEERIVTGDGIELTFQVNHLAPFLLTTRLLERDPPRRVVHVASIGQERPDLGDLVLERGYDEWFAYRQSKLAQIMFSFECARRFPDVESVALHPATFMDTKIVRSRSGPRPARCRRAPTRRSGWPPSSTSTSRAATSTACARPAPTMAYDADARKRLWDVSEQLLA